MKINNSKKVLFLLTEDYFFCSHFMDRAKNLQENGYDLTIVAKKNSKDHFIRSQGFKFININFSRKSINPISEILIILKIIKLYFKIKPDLVHHVALKPILYGGIASILLNIKYVISAPVGMGYIFSSKDLKAIFIRPLFIFSLKLIFKIINKKISQSNFIFENKDDMQQFINWKVTSKLNSFLIQGAGVDINKFKYIKNRDNKKLIVSFISRMLLDKGINEFIQAAKLILEESSDIEFWLIGDIDKNNPTSISKEKLIEWNQFSGIRWFGWQNEIVEFLYKTDIACLPSYREGLPKSLIEAAATGLPIISTDTTGCREVVIHNLNGILVPVGDYQSLKCAILSLMKKKETRKKMGKESRKLVLNRFSKEIVNNKTLALYKKILG
tara:strand:+ start:3982 stop:5136 length:1155 start_codon:yes stop_codon:yes gene_type:complete